MVSFIGNSTITLELWRVEVDKTDEQTEPEGRSGMSPEAPVSHDFSHCQNTYSPSSEAAKPGAGNKLGYLTRQDSQISLMSRT